MYIAAQVFGTNLHIFMGISHSLTDVGRRTTTEAFRERLKVLLEPTSRTSTLVITAEEGTCSAAKASRLTP